jgi:multiple sugar transport system permease protein
MTGRRKISDSRKERTGYFYILPAIIFMLAFIGYPIIYNLSLSLYKVDVMTFNSKVKEFIGLANFKELFQEKLVFTAMKNTFLYTVGCITIQFTIGFAMALFFSMRFKLAEGLRGLIVVSWMIPMTVTALLFKFMLSPSGGIINEILMSLHLIKEPVGWLIEKGTAIWGLIIANSWVGIPFNMILLTTGITGIPKELYESASVDGANVVQRFFRITLPMLKPAILSVLVLGFIYTFKVFDLVFIMTNGGPVNATEVLSTMSYRYSFAEFNFSKGAAVANILFVILFIVSLGYVKLIKEDEVM